MLASHCTESERQPHGGGEAQRAGAPRLHRRGVAPWAVRGLSAGAGARPTGASFDITDITATAVRAAAQPPEPNASDERPRATAIAPVAARATATATATAAAAAATAARRPRSSLRAPPNVWQQSGCPSACAAVPRPPSRRSGRRLRAREPSRPSASVPERQASEPQSVSAMAPAAGRGEKTRSAQSLLPPRRESVLAGAAAAGAGAGAARPGPQARAPSAPLSPPPHGARAPPDGGGG
ncbi:hypothetical protein SVAN01_11670, partial [Stagonosporopsis vannaccii]